MNLHENKKLFTETVLAASEYLGVNAVYIEKDYWITRTLRLMAQNKNSDRVVFKGGTSLSKAYHLINRFSEDIDIAVIDADSMTGNQLKMLIKKVAKEITADLEEMVINGVTSKGSRFYKAMYAYPNIMGQAMKSSVNIGQLMVEINSFANPYPFDKLSITSFITDFYEKTGNGSLIEKYELNPFTVNVLDKRRTFSEKLVSLIRFSYSENYIYDLASKIRHFYDLHFLLQNPECADYLNSVNFKTDFAELLTHDQQTFDSPLGWHTKKLTQSPLITDFPILWRSLSKTYQTELPGIAFAKIPEENIVADSFKRIIYQLIN